MEVYEFGTEHEKIFAMFQCAAEPWWVFEASAKELGQESKNGSTTKNGIDEGLYTNRKVNEWKKAG